MVIRALITSQQLATRIENYSHAMWAAENILYSPTHVPLLKPTSEQIETPSDDTRFVYDVNVDAWPEVNETNQLNKINLEVSWGQNSNEKLSLVVLTMISDE